MYIKITKFQKGILQHLIAVRKLPIKTDLILAIMGWKISAKEKTQLPDEINPTSPTLLTDLNQIFPPNLSRELTRKPFPIKQEN